MFETPISVAFVFGRDGTNQLEDVTIKKHVKQQAGGRAPSHWIGALICLALIAIVCLVTFGPSLGGDFLNWDDDRNFLANEDFRGLGSDHLRWAWNTYHLGVWQPLSWLLFGAQWCLAGLSATMFHSVSLILHGANALLLYFLTFRILRITAPRGELDQGFATRIGAIAAAILFVCHPLRVEAVVWASCQPYLPSVTCYLLAVLAYLKALESSTKARLLWYALCWLAFLAAVGFKAVAVSLPVILLILDIWVIRRRRPDRQNIRPSWARIFLEKLPFVLVAIPVSLWAIAAKDFNDSHVPWADIRFNERIAQSAYGIVFYLCKSIVPVDLNPYYRIPDSMTLAGTMFISCLGIASAVTLTLIVCRRRWPVFLAAWLAYIAILLPNLGVIQFSQQLATDRYSYLAIMPIMIVVAGLIASLWRRTRTNSPGRTVLVLTLAGLTMGCIAGARNYARCWNDSISLWTRVLALDPDCAVAHCNLGDALLRQNRFADASLHFSKAIDLDPNFSFAYANFSAMLVRAGRLEDAVTAGERALSSNPPLKGKDLAKAHAILGEAYAGLRKDDLAWQHTLKAKDLGFREADKMIEYLSRFSRPPTTQANEP